MIIDIKSKKVEEGLDPPLFPAEIMQREWLTCGRCHYNGLIQWWVLIDGDIQPLCHCPLKATLRA